MAQMVEFKLLAESGVSFFSPNFKEVDLDFWLNMATFWAQVVMNLKLWTLKFICRSLMYL